MKKFKNLGRILSKAEQKNILGGNVPGNSCNAYCGVGSGQQCDTVCPHCVDAGNGSGTGPGQDKLCVK
ncbi:MAG: hypothetical protein H0U27_11790 [Nitrosopumilus sp.]|jgi:hypothetical protein|nr:hypothetical protein [Nitrosopumilus sp.]